MGFLRLSLVIPGLFFTSFLPWYFLGQPKRILENYVAYSNAVNEVLSIPFLVRTLFSPWKSIEDEFPSNLLEFEAVGMAITLNITSRVIGCLFRIIALAFGIVGQAACFAVFMTYFVLWMVYPGVLVAALLYFAGLY